jgi:hypothetical protein
MSPFRVKLRNFLEWMFSEEQRLGMSREVQPHMLLRKPFSIDDSVRARRSACGSTHRAAANGLTRGSFLIDRCTSWASCRTLDRCTLSIDRYTIENGICACPRRNLAFSRSNKRLDRITGLG